MKQLLVHSEGRREGCMIGVSGVSVTVSVRALVNSGCSNPETMYLCLYLQCFPRIKSELPFACFPTKNESSKSEQIFAFFTDLSMWESSSSRNVSLYKVTFDDQNNLSQGKNNCLFQRQVVVSAAVKILKISSQCPFIARIFSASEHFSFSQKNKTKSYEAQ